MNSAGSASILISLTAGPVEDRDWIRVSEELADFFGFEVRSGGNHSFSWYISWISYSESSELELELVELDPEEDEVKVAGARLMLLRGRLSWHQHGLGRVKSQGKDGQREKLVQYRTYMIYSPHWVSC